MKQLLLLMIFVCQSVLLTDEQAKLMKVPTFQKLAYGIVGVHQKDTDSLALKKIDVSVETHGLIAHVVTELKYHNTAPDPIKDTKFVFPLDANASVFHLEVQCTGMERIVAQIDEKQNAKQRYSKAINEGRTAVLGEHKDDHADVFSLSLGNIPELADCTAVFKYVQEMYKYNFDENNMMFFRYPVELTHRYGEKTGFKGGVSQEPFAEMKSQQLGSECLDFNFELKVVEPSTTAINLGDDERFHITEDLQTLAFKKEYKFEKNIDVFIKLPNDNKPVAILEKGNPADQDFSGTDVLMVNFNPELPKLEESADQEFVMILDRSYSMEAHMETAKKTVLEWIDQLPEGGGCRFNIVSFGSRFVKWSENSVQCTEEIKVGAMLAVESFDADLGGTELLDCLNAVLQSEAPTGIKQIFVVTDGAIDSMQLKNVIDLVRRRKDYNRIFSFGIGAGASSELVQGIAQFNGISRLLTKDVEFLRNSVKHALSVSKAAAFHNIQVTIAGEKQYSMRKVTEEQESGDVIMTNVPFGLFQGVPFSVYAQLPPDFPKKNGQLTIKATDSNGFKVAHSVPFSISSSESVDLPIHRLAAKRFIDELTNDADFGTQRSRDQILGLSKNMNVVSKLTAFIGVGSNHFENLVNEPFLNREKSYSKSYANMNTNESCIIRNTGDRSKCRNEGGFFIPTSSFDQRANFIPESRIEQGSSTDKDDLYEENKVELDSFEKTKSYTQPEESFSKFYDGKFSAESLPPIKKILPPFPRSFSAEKHVEQVALAKSILRTAMEVEALFKLQMKTRRVLNDGFWKFSTFPIALTYKNHLYVPSSVDVLMCTTTVAFRCTDDFDVQTITFEVQTNSYFPVETTITVGDYVLSPEEAVEFLSENEIFVISLDDAKEFYKVDIFKRKFKQFE